MKMAKAPELLKKAAAMCKSKSGMFAARLLILASLQRQRMSTVAVISQKIHALIVADRERVECRKALMLRKTPVVMASAYFADQLAMFDQEDGHGSCPDWTFTHPLFNDEVDDNCCYTDNGDVLVHNDGDEPSVMDVIRYNREVEGLEFNMEEEIDQAADMFIKRFRQRLNKGF